MDKDVQNETATAELGKNQIQASRFMCNRDHSFDSVVMEIFVGILFFMTNKLRLISAVSIAIQLCQQSESSGSLPSDSSSLSFLYPTIRACPTGRIVQSHSMQSSTQVCPCYLPLLVGITVQWAFLFICAADPKRTVCLLSIISWNDAEHRHSTDMAVLGWNTQTGKDGKDKQDSFL